MDCDLLIYKITDPDRMSAREHTVCPSLLTLFRRIDDETVFNNSQCDGAHWLIEFCRSA